MIHIRNIFIKKLKVLVISKPSGQGGQVSVTNRRFIPRIGLLFKAARGKHFSTKTKSEEKIILIFVNL
jgi:hypothetical protein